MGFLTSHSATCYQETVRLIPHDARNKSWRGDTRTMTTAMTAGAFRSQNVSQDSQGLKNPQELAVFLRLAGDSSRKTSRTICVNTTV